MCPSKKKTPESLILDESAQAKDRKSSEEHYKKLLQKLLDDREDGERVREQLDEYERQSDRAGYWQGKHGKPNKRRNDGDESD